MLLLMAVHCLLNAQAQPTRVDSTHSSPIQSRHLLNGNLHRPGGLLGNHLHRPHFRPPIVPQTFPGVFPGAFSPFNG